MMDLILQTLLFTPATRPDRFAKAAAVAANVLIIDLEDAVAPSDKSAARVQALLSLPDLTASGCICAIRINPLDTRAGLDDVVALLENDAKPDIVMVPKVESSTHLRLLDRLLNESGCESRLIGLVESVRAIRNLHKVARSTPRLIALMLGAADLAADYGCSLGASNLDAARVQLVQACTLARISAIDAPFFDINDRAGLQRASQNAADMGFVGKAAIHPQQIEAIRSAFTPTPEALERARAILHANESGVGTVQGQMVDEAIARRARQILRSASS